MSTQLVARIKKTSKYSNQAPDAPGGWFDIRIDKDRGSYEVIGNRNYYTRRDVAFGVRLADGTVYDLTK